MGRQLAGCDKVFEADVAPVRLFSGMPGFMDFEVRSISERRPTKIALERLGAVVNTLMQLQVTCGLKRLWTKVALILFLAGMKALMNCQIAGRGKFFQADVAAVNLFSDMPGFVGF